jgi:uncharacterized LabA/DUF88 family protein
MNNIAYVDGQNLYMGTSQTQPPWEIDLKRFRVYLEQKYHVKEAYYLLGHVNEGEKYTDLYNEIQLAGFVLQFRQHTPAMLSKKKGNVDTDLVFSIMKHLYKQNDFDKVILVSGDGDYKKLVDFLIEENKFEKILFPNSKFASSLYKQLGNAYFAPLDRADMKKLFQKRPKEKGA